MTTPRVQVDQAVVDRLAAAGVASPHADARLLTRVAAERGVSAEVFADWVARRASREPLQLVLGVTWFRNVEITCRPGVFVPRPETEVVAGLAIDAARSAGPAPLVVETCSGTGAITCALVTEVPGVRVVAVELDPTAADLAASNVAAALDGRTGTPAAAGAHAEVVAGSLLDPVDPGLAGHLDVLVANPPYLPADDTGTWDPEVAAHDPVVALVAGDHGNELVDRLAELACRWLRPGGTLVVELDPRLAAAAADHARAVGLVDVRVAPDLTGRDRALVARRAG